MWKAAAGTNVKSSAVNNGDADEWETDPDFVNDVSEKEQRWGAKTVEGSGHQASLKLDQLRDEVLTHVSVNKSLHVNYATMSLPGRIRLRTEFEATLKGRNARQRKVIPSRARFLSSIQQQPFIMIIIILIIIIVVVVVVVVVVSMLV